ncbi:serine protease [Agaricicola taiwanensis]|uniref:Probable periplasmic serine endoprotease DegP-like n=1 Tax=Agaricicola taiwanensis TaxID=591372 RepID=A0A8J2YHB8_9RHOB|nr:Do family serine endopeptidase [Agaricicola taiwanensis]GGE42593.1 serine protease [Agaricicola taiwanensis]
MSYHGVIGRTCRSSAAALVVVALAFPLTSQAQTVAPAPAQARGPEAISTVINDVIDTVVLISTSESVSTDIAPNAEGQPELSPDVPLDEFFKEFFERQEQGESQGRPTGEGSGFVVDPSGLIVTNNHVIEGSDGIEVTLNDGTKLPAEVVGRDKETDIAVLRVKPSSPLKAVKYGNSDALTVGEWVVALGNPFGIGLSASSGIISGRNRDIRSGRFDAFIQTDASINKGNSGGPLFNLNGEVIGINTAILSPTGGSIGIGFAVPITTASRVVDQLVRYGETRRGYMGVRIQDVTSELLSRLGLDRARGALIAGVTEEGPAAKAGLKIGDVVLSIDGKPVPDSRALQRIVADAGNDRAVDVVILRDRKEQTLKVMLGRLEKETDDTGAAEPAPEVEQTGTADAFGAKFANITDELRRSFSIDQTVRGSLVVVEVSKDAPLAAAQIAPGFVLLEVQQHAVRDGEGLKERIKSLKATGKTTAQLLFSSPDGAYRFVTAKLD